MWRAEVRKRNLLVKVGKTTRRQKAPLARDKEAVRTSCEIRGKLIERKFYGAPLTTNEKRILKRINRDLEEMQEAEMMPGPLTFQAVVEEMRDLAKDIRKLASKHGIEIPPSTEEDRAWAQHMAEQEVGTSP
jgi:hypothetical protein